MKSERFLLLNIAFSVFIGLVVGTCSGGDARKTLCIERERQALLEFKQDLIDNSSNNNLDGIIPDSIGSSSYIESLQLRNNNFTGALPTFLKNCRELKILDVGENKLSVEIPSWIGSHLTNLVVLSLRVNRFNGSIPPSLCHLNQVHILDLYKNNLSGEVPRCMNNITSLLRNDSLESSIHFDYASYGDPYHHGNKYMGDALVQWKRSGFVYNKTLGLLKIINFSSNELAGRIPEEIAQLDRVLSLNLSRNNLTGNIIEGIGKMEKLESLDLSENQLTGRIPTSLAQLNFLSVLDLSSNNLLGKISSSTQLQSFDPSSYAGNNEHCGAPFAECPIADYSRINNLDEDDKIMSFGFYVCVASGFIPQAVM
ncbi:hypothetical protein K7X08_016830 [Anisodus acutangulus]|uniref:Uncharacterized protein n=1 Tax=Anisodus acutangulus TaxID=402998 RepID=A0A9Q1LRA0_9SOLA|nr:hypothetical protein K7X08_016830 [Anisodus acutangulus]